MFFTKYMYKEDGWEKSWIYLWLILLGILTKLNMALPAK